jgi:hypothetical protein
VTLASDERAPRSSPDGQLAPGLRDLRSVRPWLLFGSVFAIHIAIALVVGEVAWDDGYITLSFARTFAETGHIGLTPISETVEGATCPAWFLLMSGIYKLGITSFYGFHLASQLLAAACAATAALLLYRLILPSVPQYAWAISFLVLLLGAFRSETANGMEMTLLGVVVLGILNTMNGTGGSKSIRIALLAALVPWIRLEALAYVVVGAVALIVFSRGRKAAVALVAGAATSFVTLALVRYFIFGALGLTNTMLAKTSSPYSPPFGTDAWIFQLTFSVLVEPLITLLPPIVIGVFLMRITGVSAKEKFQQFVRLSKSRKLPEPIGFGLAYGITFVLLTMVVGSNYFSRPGRMGSSATLALVAVVALAIPAVRGRRASRCGIRSVAIVFALVPLLGVASDDVVWMYLSRVNTDPALAFNSTTAYRKNGEAIDHVRQLLHREEISALFADVGAASLCCQKIQVLDLGLLANRDLAKSGWSGFSDYLERRRPDLIQTHGVWSQESRIYEDDYFRKNYTPVVAMSSLFFLRNDNFIQLKHLCINDAPASGHYFYAGMEPASSSRETLDASVIDKNYIDALGINNFCRVP